MALDGLVAAIERLKATIVAHRALLVGSEALTRYALIDPLLRALEWDTADPAIVRPEYRDASGIADYVLMGREKPAALLEAKKFGVALDQNVILQALTYCNSIDIEHMIVSDGSQWLLYNAFKRGQLQDRVTTTFNVERDDAHAVALKALYLWRPNLSAQSVTAPPELAAAPSANEAPAAMATSASPAPAFTAPSASAAPTARLSGGGWRSLSEVAASYLSGSPRPTHLRLPDNSEAPVGLWKDVLHETAKWLVRQGKIGPHNLPVRSGRSWYIASTQPVHASGKPFLERRDAGGGVYVETHHSTPSLMNVTAHLLQHCGINDLDTVKLRFGD